MTTESTEDATLRQGGDLRGLVAGRDYLDLGTCVNRYGPPPGVRETLRELDIRRLQPHPYEASRIFRTAYAEYLGVPAGDLLAGRGITEFIRLLAAVLPADRAAVVTPDYTDSIRSFANHLPPPPGALDDARTRLARIAGGMDRYDYVLVSNPNNPLGLYVPAAELAAVCRAHPRSTLIVDEAYIDFTVGGPRWSMIWAGVPNVVVLLSPNKLFGIAGTRTGVMWTPDAGLRGAVAARQLNWSISYLDAVIAATALRSAEWAARTRERLLATASRMESLLVKRFSRVVTEVPVHYRFVATERAGEVYQELAGAGVVARVFSGRQPGRESGLRITAPTEAEFPLLAGALAR